MFCRNSEKSFKPKWHERLKLKKLNMQNVVQTDLILVLHLMFYRLRLECDVKWA